MLSVAVHTAVAVPRPRPTLGDVLRFVPCKPSCSLCYHALSRPLVTFVIRVVCVDPWSVSTVGAVRRWRCGVRSSAERRAAGACAGRTRSVDCRALLLLSVTGV